MNRFSAQYVFTNSEKPLKRGIVTTSGDGEILNVEDTGGNLQEKQSVMFYNGIIIPAFVNCHCHLELSHMKGAVPMKKGLSQFIMDIRNTRKKEKDEIISAATVADVELWDNGIVLCADICNTSDTFNIKNHSRIKYLNLLEVFGIDSTKAEKRIDEVKSLKKECDKFNQTSFIVPHSTYSLSIPLFRLIKNLTRDNRVTSIHFMESSEEKDFIENQSGTLMESYFESGLITSKPDTVKSHSKAILEELSPAGNLILVHNTFIDRNTFKEVNKRNNTYWCLCPGSNLYIENRVPPADMILSEGGRIVLGTDSLASNNALSILEEMKIIQEYFPDITLEEIIRWATINGAQALGYPSYGSIVPGTTPGLLLLEDIDLVKMKLLPETRVKRLI